MPELPRLKQWADIGVVPRATPSPETASMESGALAQGASQLSSVFGHITAKDVALAKQEKDLTSRFAAESASYNAFQDFQVAADNIQHGKATYKDFPNVPEFADREGPIQTDDLPRAYRDAAESIYTQYRDGLQAEGHGALAGYAFANEYHSHIFSYSSKLLADRDRRKVGDLQSSFDELAGGLKKQVAIGTMGPTEAYTQYKNRFDAVANQIYTPEQAHLKFQKDTRDIRMAPTMQAIADGKGPDLFEQLQSGELSKMIARGESSLKPEDLPDLREALLKDNWQTQSYRASLWQEQKKKFEENSSNLTKNFLELARKGRFTRADLEHHSTDLSQGDYDFLDKTLLSLETVGGAGNPVLHSDTKLNIGLQPDNWTPERVYNYAKKEGMNSGETLDLINELFKANQQRRTAENDPNHFSKDPQFKRNIQGLRKALGISPFSVLKPQDENMAEQAEHDYFMTFQRAYDENKPRPNFETEYLRVIKTFRPKFTWITEDVPYTDIGQAAKDFKAGKLTPERFIEIGEILKRKKAALQMEQQESGK